MERCPTCNAAYKGTPTCRRCKTDLRPLLDIEKKSRTHYNAAAAAFTGNDFNGMFFHAKRSFSLMQTPENYRMFACSALLIRRFDIALALGFAQK
ncbi:MAG: hypothetical protein JRD93_02325 [Deltaproteobacteria bacterium]|nr:hypothetical protein [Deltaproteobacteria bacterium]MBW2660833.1 hypothetical protein [Deltaproteobacteria bacterium]